MAPPDIGRDKSRDWDIAPSQGLKGVFVQLYEALACLAHLFHRRVKWEDSVLASAADFDAVKADVCHLGMAALEHGRGSVGFNIATNLWDHYETLFHWVR